MHQKELAFGGARHPYSGYRPFRTTNPIPSILCDISWALQDSISADSETLSALIESCKPSSQTFSGPSILPALQPNASIVEAMEDIQAAG